MTRFILFYGSAAGLAVSAFLIAGIFLIDGPGSPLFGYLTMLVSLSVIFLAVKRYRDRNGGGVIKFWPALALGVSIAVVAATFYVLAWEIYFNASNGAWLDGYVDSMVANRQAGGAGEEALAAYRTEMEEMMALYRNWWFRIPVTYSEILPVGVLISLVSAGLLRNARFLPARG